MKRIITILATLLILVMLVGVISITAIASHAPPGVPQEPSSGGGGGGGSYIPPKFVPYTKPVNSSDGATIGQLDGKDFTSVELKAQKNGTVDGMAYTLTITGELSHDPPAGSLVDITFGDGDVSGLPDGLGYGLLLGRVIVSMTPADGWSFNSGPVYDLSISGDSLKSIDPGTSLYLSWTDGSQYHILKLNPTIGNGSASFKFNPPGHDGTFTIYSAAVFTPTPTPEPTPSSTPAPTAQSGISPVLLVGLVAALGIVGAMGFFVGTRFK